MMIADDSDQDFPPNDAQALWHERERRQRSVRFLMMFLLMLLLMDGEEQSQRRRSHDGGSHLRGKMSKSIKDRGLDQSTYELRQEQDRLLGRALRNHPKYRHLIARNGGKDADAEIRAWAEQHLDFDFTEDKDPSEEGKLFHYPWNATGFYRGEWTRTDQTPANTIHHSSNKKPPEEEYTFLSAEELEKPMADILEQRQEQLGIFLLPPSLQVKLPNSTFPPKKLDPASNRRRQSLFLRGTTAPLTAQQDQNSDLHVTLSKTSGRAAFQLYSRSVPATKEISVLNGFVKLYDSNTVGYSTRRDILLRVTGVIFHSLGKISLVANAAPGRSALVIHDGTGRRRHLQQSWPVDGDISPLSKQVSSGADEELQPMHRQLVEDSMEMTSNEIVAEASKPIDGKLQLKTNDKTTYIFPYPYAIDDKDRTVESMRKNTPAARSMPPREQLLEANAGRCEFEISMDVQEEEWTLSPWRKLVVRQHKEAIELDPASQREKGDPNEKQKNAGGEIGNEGAKHSTWSSTSKPTLDQALVMTMNGTIRSENCNFSSSVNATAIRTDWENTTGKAINYSFYMMLTCLAQIVLLLRQLLHTQTQSAATKVSLLCIGWQTVLDALLCLVHIYLSLAMQPLFTAFASVAFFKLLIFCVIEMKYMAIIIQARNANNGGNTIELLRRQIAMLHLRFYVALIGCFLLFFYAWESHRTIYVLCLYSFWVPQIIQNVVTEAKRPLHPYYVHGMSCTRLIAPLYMFAVRNNFLKEVYPDSPTNTFMCQLLVLWVFLQSAVLEAQGRYGTRFMIPARFLPPKFDYSRPIPESLLGASNGEMTPSECLRNERGAPTAVRSLIPSNNDALKATGGARNRIKGSRANRSECSMTTEVVNTTPSNPQSPSFDCVICYSEIDVRNRRGYMLAPCDHLFHRECLEQWMEVKMECPICRHDLPSL